MCFVLCFCCVVKNLNWPCVTSVVGFMVLITFVHPIKDLHPTETVMLLKKSNLEVSAEEGLDPSPHGLQIGRQTS